MWNCDGVEYSRPCKSTQNMQIIKLWKQYHTFGVGPHAHAAGLHQSVQPITETPVRPTTQTPVRHLCRMVRCFRLTKHTEEGKTCQSSICAFCTSNIKQLAEHALLDIGYKVAIKMRHTSSCAVRVGFPQVLCTLNGVVSC